MRLFNFLRKKRKPRDSQSDPISIPFLENHPALEKIISDVENLQAQIHTMNIALKKHDEELTEHRTWMGQHSEKFEKLEETIRNVQIIPPAPQTIAAVRPTERPTPSITPTPPTSNASRKFDMNRFSEQQKRILAVFFQNQGMALSYADIGSILNKSPHTVKNQMREIRMKADLFETSLGEQSRRRFKLKNDLRIEKYLNVG